VPRVLGRTHAIEHVGPARHALDEVLRRPGSHEISRLRVRKTSRGLADDLVHRVDRLPDAQAADRVALEPDRLRRVSALAPEIREHPALDDAELSLTGVADDDI